MKEYDIIEFQHMWQLARESLFYLEEANNRLKKMTKEKDFYVREFKRMQKYWINAMAKLEKNGDTNE